MFYGWVDPSVVLINPWVLFGVGVIVVGLVVAVYNVIALVVEKVCNNDEV